MNDLYAITFKSDNSILDRKQYVCRFNRIPKSIYQTLKHAKAGFSKIPDELKDLVCITRYKQESVVLDGIDLKKTQKINKDEKVRKAKIKSIICQLKSCELNQIKFNELQAELENLKK